MAIEFPRHEYGEPAFSDDYLISQRVAFLYHANALVSQAAHLGVVLTIEQKPLLPLAMGHHETLVSIRPVRS